MASYSLIGLRNAVNKKEIPKKENLDEIIDIVEKTLDFKQQKGKGLKILTLKQILQKLPITAREQKKTWHAPENLQNKATEITKKVYSNIINSVLL